MNDMHLFPELSSQEVDDIFSAYIEREVDEVPTDIFFAMMTDVNDDLVHDVVIESELVGETLVLHPPKDGSFPFTVQGNEITVSSKNVLSDYRIRLRWVGERS